MLSILALLDGPTSGPYWFGGRRVDQLSPGEKARMRNVDVGLIFQSFDLIGDMTVYENVEDPLTLHGVQGADRTARVDLNGKEHAVRKIADECPPGAFLDLRKLERILEDSRKSRIDLSLEMEPRPARSRSCRRAASKISISASAETSSRRITERSGDVRGALRGCQTKGGKLSHRGGARQAVG